MQTLSLNGSWNFRFEENRSLEECDDPTFQSKDILTVPGCFDMMPDYYCKRGTGLFRRKFTLEKATPNAILVVEGMGLRVRFRVDGREIGTSALPYSTLEIPVGPLDEGDHEIFAALDNRFDAEKMKLFLPYYDFFAFGGFYHGMSLKLTEHACELDRIFVRTLDIRSGKVELEATFFGESPKNFDSLVRFDTGTTFHPVAFADGKAELTVPDFRLWSPESPALHTVTVKVGESHLTERFGIREIRTSKKQLLLNGKPLYLKGFNRHESHLECGAATPETVMIEDLQNLRRLHCNFVRGCHYPQTRRFLELCDEFGMLVWEESLGWGNRAAQMSDAEFIRQQEEQTLKMVRNSFNHPSVIIFAFLNENESHTPEGRALDERLIRLIKRENSGRLVTFACNRALDDDANYETDLIAYNTYPGWINTSDTTDPMEEFLPNRDQILAYLRGKYGEEKPIIVSEMGTCGIYGAHDAAKAQWTEEFQAEYLEHVIDSVFDSDEICGLTIWQFTDAKSYLRCGCSIRTKPFAQNLAGVFDGYRRAKLAAKVVQEKFAKK